MKKLLILPMLLFFMNATFAQEKTGSLLWRISGNGLTQPSYIFGTHHLLPLSFLDRVVGLKEAFASSEQVVGELIMADMAAMNTEIQRLGMMPQDSTWQMLLSAEDYRFVDEQLTALLGAGLQAFGALKPFMINLMYVAISYQMMFPETNPSESMDAWFQQEAVGRGMPVIGLETVQDQVNALTVSPLKQQAAELVCAMRHSDFAASLTKRMNSLYESADLAGLMELLREDSPCAFSAEQEYALNNARNKRWLEKLPAIMAEKPSFIAVGALHLGGEVGVLFGLAQAGFTVEAVK